MTRLSVCRFEPTSFLSDCPVSGNTLAELNRPQASWLAGDPNSHACVSVTPSTYLLASRLILLISSLFSSVMGTAPLGSPLTA